MELRFPGVAQRVRDEDVRFLLEKLTVLKRTDAPRGSMHKSLFISFKLSSKATFT